VTHHFGCILIQVLVFAKWLIASGVSSYKCWCLPSDSSLRLYPHTSVGVCQVTHHFGCILIQVLVFAKWLIISGVSSYKCWCLPSDSSLRVYPHILKTSSDTATLYQTQDRFTAISVVQIS
jgi:hypothetical protein